MSATRDFIDIPFRDSRRQIGYHLVAVKSERFGIGEKQFFDQLQLAVTECANFITPARKLERLIPADDIKIAVANVTLQAPQTGERAIEGDALRRAQDDIGWWDWLSRNLIED